MAEETITILRIDTGEAVRNINDLKENIKLYKEALSELQIGSEDYKNVLTALETNQAALKNAMHGTATTMEQIAAAAHGTDESYNGLVRRMAILKEELRATDISTESGAQKFATLAGQINETNEKLKLLDKMQGNYQRNVGNYKSALDGLTGGFKATAGSAASVIQPLANMNAGLNALSATPVIAVLGLLANALSKVVSGLKSSEENTNSWNRALAAFQPIADAFTRTIQAVGKAVADTANRIADLMMEWGLLDEEAARRRQNEMEMSQMYAEQTRVLLKGSAQLEVEIAELREKASDKEKYTAEQRLGFLKEVQANEERLASNRRKMAQWRLDELQAEAAHTENSKEVNDQLNQAEIDLIRTDAEAAAAKRRTNREISRVTAEMNKNTKATKENAQAVRKEWGEALEAVPATLSAQAEAVETAQDQMDKSFAKHIEKRSAMNRANYEEEIALNKARVEAAFGYANALSNVLGSVADMYEANGDADEKSAKKAKELRTASAVISTISGAISAYMNTIESIKFPAVAIPLAIANAAIVFAAGMAQIKQINAVKVGSSSGGGGVSAPAAAAVSAPAFDPSIPSVRNVTGKSEVERLNRMGDPQRVYILASDLQAEREDSRVRVRETTW